MGHCEFDKYINGENTGFFVEKENTGFFVEKPDPKAELDSTDKKKKITNAHLLICVGISNR